MNRALHAALLALLLAVGLASAQDPLQSYALANEALSEASTALPDDPALARDALARVANTLRPLSRDASSPQLPQALERVIERAQTAVDNRSSADLAVQIAVLRGGLHRLLYESALRAASDGDLATAQERLAVISRDVGAFEPRGESAQELLASFEAGMANMAQTQVARAETLLATDKGAAYAALAQGYAAYFPVQDSPRLPTSLSPVFSRAFQALVADDADTFAAAAALLRQALEAFETAARTGAPTAAVEADAPASDTLLEPEIVAEGEDDAQAAPTSEASPAESTAESTAATPAATPLPTDTEERAVDGEGRDDAAQALEQAFTDFGVQGAVAAQLAAQYRARGLGGVEAAFQQLYATGARALVAAQRAEQQEALAALAELETDYRLLVSPLVQSEPAAREVSVLLAHLQGLPEVRQQDVALLLGEIETLERSLAGGAPSLVQQLMRSSEPLWSGWVRLIALLVIAVLAFVPLRLLNLAFGGANRNWRLISAALFLLLLPVIYEGASALLAMVAELSGVEALRVLSAFSLFQNTLSQLMWAVLTLLAITLASIGLYRICVQFGLLGGRRGKETIISTPETATRQGAIEWDEEF